MCFFLESLGVNRARA
uniref:Uncharacterized protein n=1 Tax=Arundo donax TaxID=35708 RepID=A0A0A9EMF2_ARUDO